MNAILEKLIWINLSAIVVFAAIVLLKRCLGSRMSAKFQYAIWFLLIIRLVLPFNINVSLSISDILPKTFRFVVGGSTHQDTKTIAPNEIYAEQSGQDITTHSKGLDGSIEGADLFDKDIDKHWGSEASPIHQGVGSSKFSWNIIDSFKSILSKVSIESALLGLWVLGMIVALSRIIMGYRNISIIKKESANHWDNRVYNILIQCKGNLGIKKDIPLVFQDVIKTPALTAWLRPVMLLPTTIKDCDDQELQFIVVHELNHYKRGDHFVRLLLTTLKAIYWFNPIVHIGASMIIEDMETACDAVVTEEMESKDRRAYAQTLIGLFNTNNPIGYSGLAMSAGKSRVTAEKRIRGLFMPRKTGTSVKTISLILAGVLGLACFTTACQPTPEEPVVIGKGDGKLEEIIQSKPGSQENETQNSQIQQPVATRHTDSFQGADEKVTITIDADVLTPTGNMPVVEVKPHYIDMEQVKAMAKVLFHGNIAYEPKVGFSKEDLEKEILELKQFISNEESMLEYYSGDQETVDMVKEEYENRIAEYEELYEDAPDTIEIKETDWTFRPEAHYTDMVVFGYNLDGDDDETKKIKRRFYDSEMITLDSEVLDYNARMTVFNQETTKDIRHDAIFSLGSGLTGSNEPEWEENDVTPMDMTQEEAIAMVQDALIHMGITNMQLSDCYASDIPHPRAILSEPGIQREEVNLAAAAAGEGERDGKDASEMGENIYSYNMYFTPTYENVAAHDMTSFRHSYSADNDQYKQTYPYEELKVTVKDGVIAKLDWVAPMEQVRVENENVPVLSLEEAMDTFKRQMQLEYTIGRLSRYAPENPDYNEHISDIESGEVNITDIRLGLVRIRVKDRPEAYRMVPAWMFLGNEEIRYKGFDSSKGEFLNRPFPYAVINAIDGSIIDPSQGY